MPKVDRADVASACLKNPVEASSMKEEDPISSTSPDPEVGLPRIDKPATFCILAKVTASLAMVVTPVLDNVTFPVTATDVGTFALLPTRMFPLVRVASLLNAIAAPAATDVFVTEPADGVLTPTSEMVKV
jgi:hypothetical protein